MPTPTKEQQREKTRQREAIRSMLKRNGPMSAKELHNRLQIEMTLTAVSSVMHKMFESGTLERIPNPDPTNPNRNCYIYLMPEQINKLDNEINRRITPDWPIRSVSTECGYYRGGAAL